jgi:hypothetical protein
VRTFARQAVLQAGIDSGEFRDVDPRLTALAWLAPPKSAVSYALLDVAGGTGAYAITLCQCSMASNVSISC